MKFKIENRDVVIDPIPKSKGLLTIEFKPSRCWQKNNESLNPIMRCDIEVGKDRYYLPKNFRIKNIIDIYAILWIENK